LKPGANWCWLCNYKSPPLPTAGQAAEAMPQHRPSWLALTGVVLLAVGFVPACGVAFFVTCLASLDNNLSNFESSLLIGLVGAVVMAVLIVVLMHALYKMYRRSTLPPEIRNAR
jgi:biotin transporter BioY